MLERSGDAKRGMKKSLGVGVLSCLISMAAHGAIGHELVAAGQPLYATPLLQHMDSAAVPPSVMTPDGPVHDTPPARLRNPKPTPLPAPTKLPVPAPTNHYASAATLGVGGW